MLKRTIFILCVITGLTISSAYSQVCPGKGGGENVSITVTGEAQGKPDTAYVELSAEATAGNASDALTQCQQKAQAAITAVKGLEIPGTQMEQDMPVFSSLMAANAYGIPQPMAVASGTKVSQIIRIKIKIDRKQELDVLAGQISKILDAAIKAGVGFRQPDSMRAQMEGDAANRAVYYVLEDATALRQQALDDATAQAKDIKASLNTSGVQAGKLSGVTYYLESKDRVYYYGRQTDETEVLDRNAVSSTSPDKVTVKCTLTSTYEVGEGV